ncbi:hypothetical protein A3I56_02535 [Candidatus Roizmanbacteria bacterium RIFCSPLOWO2_02_FULL_43_10]|nr:MAG: hypothetical protein A3I56_02535 [Candidatus Roizmanbacteria bacterium RIFCSPLOWO2_02_FULL_43_10]
MSMNKTASFLIGLVFLLIFAISFHKNFIIQAATEPIVYELPYPGILPDHPLYFLKRARDNVWVFFTRDNFKKAEVLLILADKKTAMALELANNDKWQLSVSMMNEANKHSAHIVETLALSKKIGTTPPSDFVDKVKRSSMKREEIMEDFAEKIPEEFEKLVEAAIKQNLDAYNNLTRL